MDRSPSTLRWYIVGVTAVSILLVSLPVAFGSAPSLGSRPVVAVVLAVAALLAQSFPIHLADKTKVDLDAAVLTAAVLLLSPTAAAVLAAAAVGVHHAARRAGWDEAVFNLAQTALYVGAGGLVFGALAAADLPPNVPGVGSWAAVLAAVAVMHLLNTLAVAGVVAIQLGKAPLQIWRDELWLDFPEHLVLVALGVLLASLAGDRPWLLPLAVPPLALVYVSLRRSAEVRAAADSVVVVTGDLLDLLTLAPRGHSRRVASWTGNLAGRVGLSDEEASAAVRAAHLHGLACLGSRPMPPAFPGVDDPGGALQIRNAVRAEPRTALLALHVSARWDGTGAPDALAGDAIPMGARLVAVADAFEQLVGTGGAGCALDADGAMDILKEGAGRIWDPRVVAALGKIAHDGSPSPSDGPVASVA